MIKTSLRNSGTGKELMSDDKGEGPILITKTFGAANGHFKSETLTAAGSVTIVEPLPRDGIVLTDLILSTDRTTGSTAKVKITDGANEIILISADMTNAPVGIAIPFRGLWQGWQSAGIVLSITGGTNPTATLAIGYYHILAKDTLTFADWDSRRL